MAQIEFPGMKAAKKKVQNDQARQLEELKRLQGLYIRVFEGEDGKAVMADLEARNFLNRPTFDPDPYMTAFNEGQRAVLVYIKNVMSIDITKEEEVFNERQSDNESPLE